MIDIGSKPVTRRRAVAHARVLLPEHVRERLRAGTVPKGDVLAVAQVAGIMAAKRTPDLVPLTHPLPITSAAIDFEIGARGITVKARVRVTGQTGVEMEALTAASVAALTVYDMCKSVDRGMRIEAVRLTHKAGGKSGEFSQD